MNRYFHSILPTPPCDDNGNNISPTITIISDNAASRLHGSSKMPSSSSSEPIPALRRTTSLPNHQKLSSSSSKKLGAASACRPIASHKVNNRTNAIPIARSNDRHHQQQHDRLYELRRMRRHSDNTLPDQFTTMETLPEQKLRTSLSLVSLKGSNNNTNKTPTSTLGKQQQQQQLSSLPFDRRKTLNDHNIHKQPSGQQSLFWTTSIIQNPLSCLSPPRMPQRQSSFSSLLPHSSSSSSSISSSHSKETTKISDQRNASW